VLTAALRCLLRQEGGPDAEYCNARSRLFMEFITSARDALETVRHLRHLIGVMQQQLYPSPSHLA